MSQLFSVSPPKISQIKPLFLLTFIVIHFMDREKLSMGIALRFKLNNSMETKLKYEFLPDQLLNELISRL